jgi:hypothetical protein
VSSAVSSANACGVYFREFIGTVWNSDDVSIEISARQLPDSLCLRSIRLSGRHIDHLTPSQARDIAKALCDAADEVERLA